MRRGVTIIELLMVMIILGVVAAMAVPRIDMNASRADAAARAVRGVLQIAQRSAITRQSNVVVTFDSTNRRMTVLEDINDNGATDAGERMTSKPLEEHSDAEIYLTVRTNMPKEFRAVTVDPAIGKTELYRYTGSAWKRMTQ
jgi:prepilin-type N-terminal cleavage/methylation domain-containing protein